MSSYYREKSRKDSLEGCGGGDCHLWPWEADWPEKPGEGK